jgi:hypothetical protein
MMRSAFEAGLDKRRALKQAESDGLVTDSHKYRLGLMTKVHAGEITLQEAQRLLKKTQSLAAKNGLITREQAFNEG